MLISISTNILDTELDLVGNGSFSSRGTGLDKNVIILGLDMSSSTKITEKKIFCFWVRVQHKD